MRLEQINRLQTEGLLDEELRRTQDVAGLDGALAANR